MTLEDKIICFVNAYSPDELDRPYLRTAFIEQLRALMDEYARNAIVHGNIPDTEHPHVDRGARHGSD
jgi:hypothetical protein